MNSEGKNIINLIKQVTELFRDLARLMETTDGLLTEYGYRPMEGSKITEDTSASISFPEKWMPHFIYRFYENTDERGMLLFVSILLNNLNGWSEFEKHGEPLLTYGWFDYGEEGITRKWGNMAKYHGWLMDCRSNMELTPIKPNDIWEGEYPFQAMATKGIELVTIKNSEDIKKRVIEPLLESIKTGRRIL